MPGVEAAGFVGPAQRLGAGERGHAQRACARARRDGGGAEARLGEHVEVGVGGEAVGAEGDADAAGEEVAEGVRRMAEGGVGARAVDDACRGPERRVGREVVAVGVQATDRARRVSSTTGAGLCASPVGSQTPSSARKGTNGPRLSFQQFQFGGRSPRDGWSCGGRRRRPRPAASARKLYGACGLSPGRQVAVGPEAALALQVGARASRARSAVSPSSSWKTTARSGASTSASSSAPPRRCRPPASSRAQALREAEPDVGLHLLRRTAAAVGDDLPQPGGEVGRRRGQAAARSGRGACGH